MDSNDNDYLVTANADERWVVAELRILVPVKVLKDADMYEVEQYIKNRCVDNHLMVLGGIVERRSGEGTCLCWTRGEDDIKYVRELTPEDKQGFSLR